MSQALGGFLAQAEHRVGRGTYEHYGEWLNRVREGLGQGPTGQWPTRQSRLIDPPPLREPAHDSANLGPWMGWEAQASGESAVLGKLERV